MSPKTKHIAVLLPLLWIGIPAAAAEKEEVAAQKSNVKSTGPALMWTAPRDIRERNLFFGPGGREHEPHGTLTYLKEDLSGTNPKLDVEDREGVRWKVKFGAEARPETVASRFIWAVGYFANEDYFSSESKVEELPAELRRFKKIPMEGGTIHDVRLKRDLKDEKKIGIWRWRHNAFEGTREFNGLRVVMALINDWDLKDENNAVYEEDGKFRIFMVSDVGATFGTSGPSWPHDKAKGNLELYRRSKFVRKVTPTYVDFEEPGRPSFHYFVNPKEYFRRRRLRWIGRHIPRDDVRWAGKLLSQLSPNQIRDAFRAAGYSAEDVEGFSRVVEDRIAQLAAL